MAALNYGDPPFVIPMAMLTMAILTMPVLCGHPYSGYPYDFQTFHLVGCDNRNYLQSGTMARRGSPANHRSKGY